MRGFFGPPHSGVFSPSLQATIYDAGCLALKAAPELAEIDIDTPNLHYLPMKALDRLGEKFEDDIFVPTSEPSGSIKCTASDARWFPARPSSAAMVTLTSGQPVKPKRAISPPPCRSPRPRARAWTRRCGAG